MKSFDEMCNELGFDRENSTVPEEILIFAEYGFETRQLQLKGVDSE